MGQPESTENTKSTETKVGRRRSAVASVVVILGLLAACSSGSTQAVTEQTDGEAGLPRPTTVTLLTHDSFAVSEDLLESFERDTGITVDVISAGDAGEVVNKAILTAGNPEGDVLFGVDSTVLTRAVESGVFAPFESTELGRLRPEFATDTSGGLMTAIDYGDVCVNRDDAWFAGRGLAPPATLEDLANPTYADLLVVENPATSSPGLAFLLATVARFGEDGWAAYWTALADNGVKVVNGWTEAYAGEFSGSSGGGERPLVVSYASSPPAEIVYAAEPKPDRPGTSVMTDGCFRQVEYAGVLAGTEQTQAAGLVIDWLVSPEVQADVPLSMFVFPARADVPLPQVFTDFAATPVAPLSLPAAVVDANRERWIDAWTDLVLR